jgi:hypothetical protein
MKLFVCIYICVCIYTYAYIYTYVSYDGVIHFNHNLARNRDRDRGDLHAYDSESHNSEAT